MTKFNLIAVSSAIALSFSVSSAFGDSSKKATKNTAELNTEVSQLTWIGKKVTGQHDGILRLKSGKLELNDKNEITGGEIIVDMTSLVVKDITDPKDNKKLRGHLMSPDFFSVEDHPTATFKITRVSKKELESGTHEVSGNLTIKGKTEKITFPATVRANKEMAWAKGTLSVDRTKFDVRYGSGKFFENLGDKTISDNFEVTLDLRADR